MQKNYRVYRLFALVERLEASSQIDFYDFTFKTASIFCYILLILLLFCFYPAVFHFIKPTTWQSSWYSPISVASLKEKSKLKNQDNSVFQSIFPRGLRLAGNDQFHMRRFGGRKDEEITKRKSFTRKNKALRNAALLN